MLIESVNGKIQQSVGAIDDTSLFPNIQGVLGARASRGLSENTMKLLDSDSRRYGQCKGLSCLAVLRP